MSWKPGATTAVAITVILWASAFVAIRVALPVFGVAGLTVGRLLCAAVVLVLAAPLMNVRLPARQDWRRLAACAATGMAGYQFLLNAGERTVAAGTASLLVNTGPIFAALLAWVLLAQRPNAATWTGIGLGAIGAGVITLCQQQSLHLNLDALLVLGAAASQATFFVLQKPLLERYTALEVTCYATCIGAVIALPGLPALIDASAHATATATTALVFLGVAASALGFATWAYALARLPVATAVNYLYLVPPVAITIGWITLGETPTLISVLGGLVIITGVAISRRFAPITPNEPRHTGVR